MQKTIIHVQHDFMHFIKTSVTTEEGEGVFVNFQKDFFGQDLISEMIPIELQEGAKTKHEFRYKECLAHPAFKTGGLHDDLTDPLVEGTYATQSVYSYWVALETLFVLLSRLSHSVANEVIHHLTLNKLAVDFNFEISPVKRDPYRYRTSITGYRTFAFNALVLAPTPREGVVCLKFYHNPDMSKLVLTKEET